MVSNKILKLVAVLSGIVLFAAGCDDSHELSLDNKGKNKPVVKATLMSSGTHEFRVAVLPSSDARYYGYVVLEGADNVAPSSYDIVTGAVNTPNLLSSNLYNVSENPSPTVKVQCSFSEDYQVFAAGISPDGLLSKVDTLNIHIEDASPGVVLVEGLYKLNAPKYNGATNPKAGQPFDVKFSKMKGSKSKYVLYANWFNVVQEGYLCPPFLIGTVDYDTKEITFDGSRVDQNGDQQPENAIGAGFLSWGEGKMLAFWGGGSNGRRDITVKFSDKGYLLTISALRVTVNKDPGGEHIEVYDALLGGETFTFVK